MIVDRRWLLDYLTGGCFVNLNNTLSEKRLSAGPGIRKGRVTPSKACEEYGQNATPIYIVAKQHRFMAYCEPCLVCRSLDSNDLL